MKFTIFENATGSAKYEYEQDFDEFADWLSALSPVECKEAAKLISLSVYGDQKTEAGSLKHAANILEVHGCEADYDGELISFDSAVRVMSQHNLRCVIMTTASHRPEAARWRIFTPFSKPLTIQERKQMIGRINWLFDGKIGAESFSTAQGFYVGEVTSAAEYRFVKLDGVCIDEKSDLQSQMPATKYDPRNKNFVPQTVDDWIHNLSVGEDLHPSLIRLTMADPVKYGEEQVRKIVQNGEAHKVRSKSRMRRLLAKGPNSEISKAVESAKRKHDEKQRRLLARQPPPPSPDADPVQGFAPAPSEFQLQRAPQLSLNDMLDQLVYVAATDQVVYRPESKIVGETSKNAAIVYKASMHTFIDADGKRHDVQAFPLWLKSPHRITVDVLTWRPGYQEFCPAILSESQGARAYNLWSGIYEHKAPHDYEERAKPFLDHVEYLVPNRAERHILLQYLAHMVQRPTELPQFVFLMYTTKTGTGRTVFGNIMRAVMQGHSVCNPNLQTILSGGFNGELSQTLLATVDETLEGMGQRKRERFNAFKKMLTADHTVINPKYGKMRIEQNCCRWLLFTNSIRALPVDRDDRRVYMIANPNHVQQDPDYYKRLFELSRDSAFIASVFQYLKTLDISEFNPGAHAPWNELKERVLQGFESEELSQLREWLTENKFPVAVSLRKVDHVVNGVVPHHAEKTADAKQLKYMLEDCGYFRLSKRLKFGGVRETVYVLESANPSNDEIRTSVANHQNG